jgi:CubicO group peptidase (beta-lactamase class C family)
MIQQLFATATAALTLTGLHLPAGGDLDGGAGSVPFTGDGAPGLSQLEGQVREYLAEHDIPGATVAVTKDSRLVWAKGYGYADTSSLTLMQPDSRTKIGSTSKVLTAIGALQLAEGGALDLEQHVYGSDASPLWGSEWGTTPGVISATDGFLENAGTYFTAMVAGVDELGQYFPPADHLDEFPHSNWALLTHAAYEQQITTTLERASDVQVKHLLSHTGGYRDSTGDAKAVAAAHFDTTEDELTPAQLHQGVLMGMAGGAPFGHDPGSTWDYSNAGFAFAGQIVGEASDEGDYRQYIDNHLLGPLGLFDVVPNNASISDLDALPHDADNEPIALDPDTISRLLLATGGWSASARDLARIMCSLDSTSNNLRSLEPESVETMMSDTAPDTDRLDAMGWDSYSTTNGELTKNGSLPNGGASRISKFLPGAFAQDSNAEINVAVAFNKAGSVGDASKQLLRDIAAIVAQADIAADYDLFDPAYACRVEQSLPATAAPATSTPSVDTTDPDRPDAGEPVSIDLRIDPGELWEQRRDDTPCGSPDRAVLFAHVASPGSVHTVELSWHVRDHEPEQAEPMTADGDGRWSGELGPFGPDTAPSGESVPVTVIVTVTDDDGRSTTAEAIVTVHDCTRAAARSLSD